MRRSRFTRGVSRGVLECGSGTAPAFGFASRDRDGTGHRLRLLGAGARSSLTERRFGVSRKARPVPRNRRAGALRSARLPATGGKTEGRCAERRSGPLALRLAFTPFASVCEG